MTLLSAFQILLQRYSGQDDFAVGSPSAGRSRSEIRGADRLLRQHAGAPGQAGGRPHVPRAPGADPRRGPGGLHAPGSPLRTDRHRPPARPRGRPDRRCSRVMFVLQNAPMARARGARDGRWSRSRLGQRGREVRPDPVRHPRSRKGWRLKMEYSADLFGPARRSTGCSSHFRDPPGRGHRRPRPADRLPADAHRGGAAADAGGLERGEEWTTRRVWTTWADDALDALLDDLKAGETSGDE